MPAGRIATVPPVSEAAATGKVAAVYADIKQTKKLESVPNFWRVLATNPDHLENTLILMPSAELSRARGGFHCMSMPLHRDEI